MKISILTTATPRFDIHEKCVIDVIDTLCNNGHEVSLYVNIDIPGFVKNAKDNTDSLLCHLETMSLASLKYHVNDTNPDFSRAFEQCIKMLIEDDKKPEDEMYMWLEDDWEIVDKDAFVAAITAIEEDTIHETFTFCNPRPSGPPMMFREKFLNTVVEHYCMNDEVNNFDPEVRFVKCYDVKFGRSGNKRLGNRSESHFPDNWDGLPTIFKDAGRAWRIDNSISKWRSKNGSCSKTWSIK